LVHRTRRSRLLMAAAMDHRVHSPDDYAIESVVRHDWARTSILCHLAAGETLRFVKFLGYGWSGHRSEPAVRDQVAAALTSAMHVGWDGLCAAQREYLDEFWSVADVQLD